MRRSPFLSTALVTLLAANGAAAQAVKWHPGHYMLLNGNDPIQTQLADIDEIGGIGAIKGVQARIWWYQLEPSKGVYDFSRIDAYLSRLKRQSTTKRLVVRIMDRRFNTTSRLQIVPDYLRSAYYGGGIVKSRTGYVARLWDERVMDRLATLYKVIGARYDGDPYFEGVSTEETAMALDAPYPSGYSTAALKTQYQRLASAATHAMPHSNVFVYANWLGGASDMGSLIQSFVATRTGAGGPDVVPYDMTLGQEVVTGVHGADYRSLLPVGSSVEGAELGGHLGNFSPRQINDFAYNTLRLNYVFWSRNTWSGGKSQQWSTGILPFLRTNPPFHGTCPAAYASCAW